jgi:hypothetical protein
MFNNYNKINQAFQNNSPLIEMPNFRNNNNVLHNNLKTNLLNEFPKEYYIYIESRDRNTNYYPSPFQFNVHFGESSGKKVIKKVIKRNTDNQQYEDYVTEYYGDYKGPVIPRRFRNVKFVRLEYVILPKTLALVQDPSGVYSFSTSSDHLLINNKYLVVKIKELSSGNILSTNNQVSDDCFIIYPDKTLGNNNVWITNYGLRTWNNSALGSVEKFSISISDCYGELLYLYNESSGTPVDLSILKSNEESPAKTSLEEIMILADTTINMTICAFENELNTNTKFEY